MTKIAYLFVGAWIAVIGFLLVVGRGFHFRGVKVDFGGTNALVGWTFIIMGIGIFVIALREKAKDFEDKFLICPKCKQPFNKKDVLGDRCPKCEVELEDLKGFYERHPELKVPDDKEPSNNKNEK